MAVWALGQIGGKRAREALRECCDCDDEALQAATEDALAELEVNDTRLDLFASNGDAAEDLDQTLVAVNDDNGLHEGRNSIQGNLAFHQELRDAVPDIVLAGEGLNEVTFQHESFAQAHVYGCYYDRALRNWALNPDVIPMIHPINSFLFEPHCRLTGYANCDGSNPHSNWILEAYERMGVLPTISTPDPPPGENMLANPNPALRRVFQMANGTLVG